VTQRLLWWLISTGRPGYPTRLLCYIEEARDHREVIVNVVPNITPVIVGQDSESDRRSLGHNSVCLLAY
jgi:hypothetical protein